MMIILLGLSIVILCTIMQCALIALSQRAVHLWRKTGETDQSFLHETFFLTILVSSLFIGMCAQVGIWAFVYYMTGELEDFETCAYFSMVSFTTVGYGDVTLSSRLRILGPMEASNGILMLGIATSFLFSSLSQRFQDLDDEAGPKSG